MTDEHSRYLDALAARLCRAHQLIWNSADGQGSIEMGHFATEADAIGAIPEALAELLGQTATDEQEADIRAGTWSVEVEDDGFDDDGDDDGFEYEEDYYGDE